MSVLTPSIKRLLPWLVAVAFFMESLDTTILNTAVPTVAAALGIAPLSMKAVLSSYTLSLAVFIPISGWMADRFGTRRVFATAIGLFTLGSLLCGLVSNIHLLVACRILQGCGGAMMLPVGRLTMVRAFAKSELVRAMSFVAIPGLIGPMLGPLAGGFIVGYFHWRVIFFLNVPIGLAGFYLVHRHLPDYRQEFSPPLDAPGLVLFGTGLALLSYVLEVFGEHTLSGRAMLGLLAVSAVCLAAYGVRSTRIEWPLLRLALFRIRTFRIAVGALIALFATIGPMTPVALIVLQVFVYGFFSSLQYTSMNTLAYADVADAETSSASTIASTMQQMSMSFGVAAASLVTAVFIPDRFHASQQDMIHSIHEALVVLGGMTVVSTAIFRGLQADDGGAVSRHEVVGHEG